MRRNELLGSLYESFIYDNVRQAETSEDILWVLDKILTYVEQEGMLPPFINDRIDHTCTEYTVCTCNCRWEAEDEVRQGGTK